MAMSSAYGSRRPLTSVESAEPPASPLFWIPILILVGLAVYLLRSAFSAGPVPPGPDTARWIAESYPYIGRPFPAPVAIGNPYSYPPLTFPLLGLSVQAAGGPIGGGFLYAGALLFAYGLTLGHLARVYIRSGPLQVALVALGLFNVSTVSMPFWGAYPNLLGFVLLNEALAFLLLFLRRPTVARGLGLYLALALAFLVHELTFVIAIGSVVLAAFVLWLHGRYSLRILATKANAIGLALLLATIAIYVAVTASLQIPHPGYFTTNPAAYQLDNLGQTFLPPSFGCGCSAGIVTPDAALVALIASALTAVLAPLLFAVASAAGARRRAGVAPIGIGPALGSPFLAATAWLAAVCAIAAVGWLAHVDTDYNRLGYFLPLPLAMAGVLALEAAWFPVALAVRTPAPPPSTPAGELDASAGDRATGPPPAAWPPPAYAVTRAQTGAALISAAIVVAVLVIGAPAYADNEATYGGRYADSNFLATLNWISAQPTAGAVLTHTANAAHWSEAYAGRQAFFPDATWLEFYTSHVNLDELSDFCFHGRFWVTNNRAMLSYPGPNDTAFNETPLYSVLVDGVHYSLLRIDPRTLAVTVLPSGSRAPVAVREPSWGTPAVSVSAASVAIAWRPSDFAVTETLSVAPAGPASLGLSVAPAAGARVESLSFDVAPPPTTDRLLRSGIVDAAAAAGSGFSWQVRTGALGTLAGVPLLHTSGVFSAAPSSASSVPGPAGPSLAFVFRNANPGAPFGLNLSLSTPSLSNPAGALPPVFDTLGFLNANDIRFVLLEVGPGEPGPATVQYFESEYAFHVAYANPEWQVLAR
jgi:hypothetical protein